MGLVDPYPTDPAEAVAEAQAMIEAARRYQRQMPGHKGAFADRAVKCLLYASNRR